MFTFDERLASLGWSDFPFRIDVLPEVFAGQKRILGPLTVQLRTGNIVLIEGGRGTGKTHILRWLFDHLSSSQDLVPCLISEPLDTNILSRALTGLMAEQQIVKTKSPPTLIDPLVAKVQEYCLHTKKRLVLLIDDGQTLALTRDDSEIIESEKRKTVRWIRILSDLPALVVYIAGLTGFGKALTSIFAPIAERVTLQFSLEQQGPQGLEVLTRNETEQLLRERIEYYGGKGITPFTPEAIDEIHLHARGYPRAILRFCENILTMAFQEDTPAGDRVTQDFVRQVVRQRPSPPPMATLIQSPLDRTRFVESEPDDDEDWFTEFDELTAIQRDILALVKDMKKVTSAVVAEELGIAKGLSLIHI